MSGKLRHWQRFSGKYFRLPQTAPRPGFEQRKQQSWSCGARPGGKLRYSTSGKWNSGLTPESGCLRS